MAQFTQEQLDKITKTIQDHSVYNFLMNNPDHEDAWTLDYIFDAFKRNEYYNYVNKG